MKEYNLMSTWTNAQGEHRATVTLQPEIATRPMHVGLSINEVIVGPEGSVSYTGCSVLSPDQLTRLYVQIGEAIGRKTGLVPVILLEQACELVDRATNLATVLPSAAAGEGEWGEIGYELERVRKQIT